MKTPREVILYGFASVAVGIILAFFTEFALLPIGYGIYLIYKGFTALKPRKESTAPVSRAPTSSDALFKAKDNSKAQFMSGNYQEAADIITNAVNMHRTGMSDGISGMMLSQAAHYQIVIKQYDVAEDLINRVNKAILGLDSYNAFKGIITLERDGDLKKANKSLKSAKNFAYGDDNEYISLLEKKLKESV